MIQIDLPDDDCLPHDRAVWRPYTQQPFGGPQEPGTAGTRVCLEHRTGAIAHGMADTMDWSGTRRWRFGWPPRSERR